MPESQTEFVCPDPARIEVRKRVLCAVIDALASEPLSGPEARAVLNAAISVVDSRAA
jgi:hypothetical protein